MQKRGRMHKYILFLFLIINLYNPAIGFTKYNTTPYNSYDLQNLNAVEYAVLGRNNTSLSPHARLALTEQRLFGTVQPGNFNNRVNFINQVLSNNNQNNLRKNRIKYAINEILNGTITGYTPPVYTPNMSYNHNLNNYNRPFYFHNTRIPQPYGNGIGNLITQTRVIIDND